MDSEFYGLHVLVPIIARALPFCNAEVKQDQVLARIEPSSFETRVREEEAGVAVARANVDLQQASVDAPTPICIRQS